MAATIEQVEKFDVYMEQLLEAKLKRFCEGITILKRYRILPDERWSFLGVGYPKAQIQFPGGQKQTLTYINERWR